MAKKIKKIPVKFKWFPNGFILPILLILTGCNFGSDIQEAISLEKEGRYSEALYIYTGILAKNPEQPRANRQIGMILAKSSKSTGAAIAHLENAYAKMSNDRELRLKLFEMYLVSGNLDKSGEIIKSPDPEQNTMNLLQSCFVSNSFQAEKAANTLKNTVITDKQLERISDICQQRHKR